MILACVCKILIHCCRGNFFISHIDFYTTKYVLLQHSTDVVMNLSYSMCIWIWYPPNKNTTCCMCHTQTLQTSIVIFSYWNANIFIQTICILLPYMGWLFENGIEWNECLHNISILMKAYRSINKWCFTWGRHHMETFSALLAICAGNSPVPCGFPAQRLVTRSFDAFFDLRLNKRLSKQSRGWWFETLPRSLWRHRNEVFKNH